MISKKELEIFEKIHLYDRYSYITAVHLKLIIVL